MSDPSVESEDLKRKIMLGILKFLQEELKNGELDGENSEGLEVAIQCLESIYKVNVEGSEEPSIRDVYKHYMSTYVLHLPDPDEEAKLEAENLKSLGNNAMSSEQLPQAIAYYTRALKLNPKNAIYYCNRAAAYSKINNHRSAIKDCEMAIEIDGSYSKAYGRLGLAYTGLENWKLAKEYYEIALSLDPKNESYKTNLQLAESRIMESTSRSAGGSGQSSQAFVPDINSILHNRELMNFAAQMLTDPSMVSAMSNIVRGAGTTLTGNASTILEAGQQLANYIQNDNPQFIEELRQRIANNTNLDQNGSEPMDHDPDAGDASKSTRKRPST